MGALFLLPVLVVWTAFVIAPPDRRWMALASGTAAVAGVMGLGRILSQLYAPPGALAGGNFALTLCGLSVGSSWSACQFKLYAKELAAFANDEAGAASWILRQAMRNIADQPTTFVVSILANIGQYIGGFARTYLHGYAGKPYFHSIVVALAVVAFIPGIVTCLKHRAGRVERLLWAGVFLAIVASAAIIMKDNGWRALHVTHALTVAFLAFAFTAPGILTVRAAALSVRRWSIALACGVLMLIAAPKALQAIHARDLACCPKPAASDTLLHVFGGRRLTGLLIVPEGTPRSPAVPSIPVGDFERIFRATMAKDADLDGVMTTVRQRAPVAFVYAQPLSRPPRGDARSNWLLINFATAYARPTACIPSLSARPARDSVSTRSSLLANGARHMRTIPGPFMTVYDVGRMMAAP